MIQLTSVQLADALRKAYDKGYKDGEESECLDEVKVGALKEYLREQLVDDIIYKILGE